MRRETAGSLYVEEPAFDLDLAHDAQPPMGMACLRSVRTGGSVRRYAEGTEGAFGAGDVLMYAPHDPATGWSRFS
ncbi:hypothetical protein [Planobispora takensis]|uniref:Uncharacterized protein n=1 Tax=Planobispora takensis TaxID=1367882 RepID=A0A8J3X026_9ACTN|nr:hypothetical protein [Planobispora takensis]GII05317.1 hypothetical protein Pta02_73250 [Planobispora takensis]